jgi:hypothetical protein
MALDQIPKVNKTVKKAIIKLFFMIFSLEWVVFGFSLVSFSTFNNFDVGGSDRQSKYYGQASRSTIFNSCYKSKKIGIIGDLRAGIYKIVSGGKMLDLSVRPIALPYTGRMIGGAQVKPKK